MCNADDTLLHTTGHQDAGHGQTLSCKNWDELREWAEDHTACYYDDEPMAELYGTSRPFLHGDGLPTGSIL